LHEGYFECQEKDDNYQHDWNQKIPE
jgi:hypothetical protein